MRRKQLVAAFMMLVMVLGLSGCHRTPAYVGEYKVVMPEQFKKTMHDAAMAFAGNDAKAKAKVEESLKKIDDDADKASVTIKEDGTCVFSSPGKPSQTGSYTFKDNKMTIKTPAAQTAATGKDLELTWDEAKGTLTAGTDAMGIVFKKK